MTVKEYLLHQNEVKRDRITTRALRATVIICLERINEERMNRLKSDMEKAKRRWKLKEVACGSGYIIITTLQL